MTRKILQYHLNEIDAATPPYGTQRDYKNAVADLALAIEWEVKEAALRATNARNKVLYYLVTTPDGTVLGTCKTLTKIPKRFDGIAVRFIPINEDRALLLAELNRTIPGRK